MVRARDFVVVNGNVALRAQFIDQLLNGVGIDDLIIHTLNDDAR